MQEQITMFEVAPLPPKLPNGKYKRFKAIYNYRKAENNCCEKCRNFLGFTNGKKNFYKCNLMGLSHSAASDIRKSYVCDLWRKNGN